jgi:hypothetical protein
VVGYARKSDYVVGGLAAAFAPAAMLVLERFAPSHAGKGGFPKIMRLATAIGLTGGFLIFYQRSSRTFPLPFPSTIKTPMEQPVTLDMEELTRMHVGQSDFMVRQRTRGSARWTCARWSTRSSAASRCTARAS